MSGAHIHRSRAIAIGARYCLVFAACLVTTHAVAKEPSASDLAVARQLFQDAIKLGEAQQWKESADKLQQAIAIKETPGLRFHLAHALVMLGRLVEAQREYDRAGELIASGMSAPDVEKLLEGAKAGLRERVPTVVVRIKDANNATLSIDGKAMNSASLGTAIPLDPGKHRIVVTAPQRKPFDAELSLAEGEDRVLEAELAPVPSGSTASAATTPVTVATGGARTGEQPAQRDRSRGFGAREAVVLGEVGVAVAGLGVGLVYFFKAQSAGDRAESNQKTIDDYARNQTTSDQPIKPDTVCTAPTLDPGSEVGQACAALPKNGRDHDNAQNISVIGFAVAGVSAAAAVGTWLLWPKAEASQPEVGVVITPRTAASSFRIRF